MEEAFGSVDCTCCVNTPAASRSPLAEGGAESAGRAGAKGSSAVLNSLWVREACGQEDTCGHCGCHPGDVCSGRSSAQGGV